VIVALDIARFSPVEALKRKVDEVIRDFRNSPRMPGVDHIRLPGEQSHATWLERSALGIPMNDGLLNTLAQVAAELNIQGLSELSR
jgi:L-2-hydroxycarboxylate dehydrogenase (NAD+)